MDASQSRSEFKFLLNNGISTNFRQELATHLPIDQGAEDGYQIESDYFDDEAQTKYWEKKFGSPSRRRVRTRVYGDASGEREQTYFIEVKHKVGGDSVKRRVLIDEDELNNIGERKLPSRDCESAQKVLSEVQTLIADPSCKPTVRIRYHRYAFDAGPESTIRITVDINLTCRFFEEDNFGELINLTASDQAIMEVKTIGNVPYWFRKLIGKHRLIPQSYSKFMTALDYRANHLPPKTTLKTTHTC